MDRNMKRIYLPYTSFSVLALLLVACQDNNTTVRDFDVQGAYITIHGRIAGNPVKVIYDNYHP